MLSITKESDYAIRAVYYLAQRRDQVIMTREIAREMRIPGTFLAKIVRKLAGAGLVKCFVGVKGGCALSRDPDEISLLDVISVIEGPMAMNSCTLTKDFCSFSEKCPVHPVWLVVRHKVEDLLKETNFGQICRDATLRL
jgi:Rrf2 family protein